MRDSDDYRLSPREKRLLRERGTLRCAWCNRRTEVKPGFRWGRLPLDDWKHFAEDNQPFFCSRTLCAQHRKEAMSRPRPVEDGERPARGPHRDRRRK